MSKNNQLLIRQFNGRWYVFNVMAESWSDDNELKLSESIYSNNDYKEALVFARDLDGKSDDSGMPTSEYGVFKNILAKDGANVKIIDDSFKEEYKQMPKDKLEDGTCFGSYYTADPTEFNKLKNKKMTDYQKENLKSAIAWAIIIIVGIIGAFNVGYLFLNPNERIIKQVYSDKVQQELASSTNEQIIQVCGQRGYIDSSKITKEQIIQAYNQIQAQSSTATSTKQ